MTSYLPKGVLDVIRGQYLRGIREAEAKYRFNAADEDSLTGALGSALSMAEPVLVPADNGDYLIQVEHRRIRGKGPGAPEKLLGADGIFEIEVFDEGGNSIWMKGLPFQSKSRWLTSSKKMIKQAKDMLRSSGTGVIIDFKEDGYEACSAEHLVEQRGSKRMLRVKGQVQSLESVLADDFLDCRIGQRNLSYDEMKERFQTGIPTVLNHLITTDVQRLKRGSEIKIIRHRQ